MQDDGELYIINRITTIKYMLLNYEQLLKN
jgi:hypothetical protein